MNAATVLLVKVPQAQRLLVTAGGRQGPPGPTAPLGNLTDVDTAGAIQGQALAYDPASGGEPWKPKTITDLLPLGAPGGIATLDGNGFIPIAQMPAVAINDTFPVNSQAEMLALAAQRGDTAIRLDTGQTFILAADDPTVLANWKLIVATAAGGAGGVLSGSYPNPGFAGSPSFTSDVPTNPILSLLAQPAQTGNFLEARDSLNNTVASISSNGAGSFASGTTVGGASVVVTTDPRLSDTRPPTGPAGGVLAGTYPNPAFAPSPTFTPSSTTTAGIIVQGLASQTADLQQWRNSAGTILGRAAADGGIYGGYFQSQSGASYMLWSQNPNALLVSTSAAYNPLVVRGTTAQTGDLQQWQNSAASPLARVESGGGIRSSVFKAILGSQPYVDLSTQDVALWNFQAATNKVVIRGFASQSANLQEWQDSTGAVVGSINAFGNVVGLTLGSAVGGKAVLRTNYDTGGIGITTAADANKGLVVRRNSATQAQSLLEIQDEAAGHLLTVGATGQLLTAVESHFAAGTFSDPVSGSSAALKIGGGNQTWGVAVQASGPANYGVLVRGSAAQTADLQEWQTSSGSVRSWVTAAGSFATTGTISASGNGGVTPVGVQTYVSPGAIATVGLVVQAFTGGGQTADLQQWQGSTGTVLSSVRNDGRLVVNSIQNVAGGTWLFVNGDPSNKLANSGSATSRVLVVQGAAGQSGPLTEWQDSTGAVLAQMLNGGSMRAPSFGSTAGSKALLLSGFDTGGFVVSTVADANKGLAIRRNSTSATANLFETQSESGVANSAISPFGAAVFGGSAVIGRVTTYTASATTIGQVIQGTASQSADLQQWQNNTGTVLAKVDATGEVFAPALLPATYVAGNTWMQLGNSTFTILTGNAANIPFAVKAYTSQTADIVQFQNSAGTALAGVASNGDLYVNSGNRLITPDIVDSSAGAAKRISLHQTGVRAMVMGSTVSDVGLVVQGTAAQTGDLLQLQDSTGAVLASINNNGRFNGAVGAIASGKAVLSPNADTGGFAITTAADANKGLVIRANSATQSANLFEAQNTGGTALVSINGAGLITGQNRLAIGASAVTINSSMATFLVGTATNVGIVVQGAASQTGDLQQWLSSAASILARVDANGIVYGTNLRTISSHVILQNENSGGVMWLDKSTAQAATPTGGSSVKVYVRDGTNAGTFKLVAVGPGGVQATILDNIA